MKLRLFIFLSRPPRSGRLLQEGVEGVGGEGGVDVAVAELEAEGGFAVGEVAGDHHVLALRIHCHEHRHGAFLVAFPAYDARAFGEELAVVSRGIVLGREGGLALLGVDAYQRVLLPTPGAFAVVGQDEVPEVIFVASVAQIVVDELECVFGCRPVKASPAAFALRADVGPVGVLCPDGGEYVASFPLEAHA